MASIQPISFRWDPEFVAELDAARGLVDRTVFVAECVKSVLEAGDDAIIGIMRRSTKPAPEVKPKPLTVEQATAAVRAKRRAGPPAASSAMRRQAELNKAKGL